MVIKEKETIVFAVIDLFTCGLFGLIWTFLITSDLKKISGEKGAMMNPFLAMLLPYFTLNIWGILWARKCGQIIPVAANNVGLTGEDKSIMFMVLQFVFPVFARAAIQKELNDIALASTYYKGPDNGQK